MLLIKYPSNFPCIMMYHVDLLIYYTYKFKGVPKIFPISKFHPSMLANPLWADGLELGHAKGFIGSTLDSSTKEVDSLSLQFDHHERKVVATNYKCRDGVLVDHVGNDRVECLQEVENREEIGKNMEGNSGHQQ